ncbi:MAG TPA: multiheme c-type cytochrome [Candidatus Methylacidiphilales bacterium]|nr:multiheme c-type cytochrome [Candidatus Methylacidiphilales bacterium]
MRAAPDTRYEGELSCQASLCHGGSSPDRGQFVNWIWSQQDYHSRSYMTLTQSRSMQMARVLGIKNPAADNQCVACHAPLALVAHDRLAPDAHVEEGVSCESCHAPAGTWLRSHTRTDYTYQQRLASGMADLKSLYQRANGCVACHQNIDSALVGAGHPLLFFEMNRQSEEEPAHWEDQEPWSGPRAWLVGQCVAFREISWKLSLGGQDPNTRAQWESLYWLLMMLSGPLGLNWDSPAMPQNASDYQHWMGTSDAWARQAEKRMWSNQQLLDCLTKLAGTAAAFGPLADDTSARDYYRLKRVALAIDSLQKPLNNRDLKSLASDLILLSSTPANFVPDKISTTLNQLATTIPKVSP